MGLHIGAGATKIPGLINCDLFNESADLKVDSRDLSQFENGSVDLIETHHMIEHLSILDTEIALKEWNRVLKQGGVLIITCPDLFRICRAWVFHSLLYRVSPQPERLEYMVQMLMGSQENEGMFHRNAFDARRMKKLLKKFGFHTGFSYSPYPLRPTPSLLIVAIKEIE